ncbi:3-phosphoshikimate 1-carboxyvinyltransferase [uncultured Prochlorococcus sp.]|uniref:3-phosphoshikimate 1-carboxyvinyltransferase n=1 Tax=uncultured Prochlorococcus sp. TaxID=159733 RepID=UPI00338F46B0
MSSKQRQELILKKMKEKGIEVGSGIPNKKYKGKEVYELIHIAKCFPELREKK